MTDALAPFAMNEDESDDVILLEQRVLDADELVEDELELVEDDDFSPTEEVILLDMMRTRSGRPRGRLTVAPRRAA